MTDNEIIKALEHCASGTGGEACEGCPFNENDICNKESYAPEKYALFLIKSQKAEIERLQQKYELSEAEREANVKGFTETLETARAEAIKEFAERLKEKSRMPLGTFYGKLVYLTDIDNLVKEMTEDEGK